jgi:phospholipase A1
MYFRNPLPMRDLNFNPGIGLMRPIIYKNKYIGRVPLF